MKTYNDTKKASQTRGVVRDWAPLFAHLQTTAEWALDLAARLADGYDEDIQAIERVRSYLKGWLAGRRIDLDLNDLLTALGILFAAIEIDRGIDSAPWLEPLRAFERTTLHFPGAAELEDDALYQRICRATLAKAANSERDTVSIRRRYRNAAAHNHLAA